MGLIQFQQLEEKPTNDLPLHKPMIIRRTIDYEDLEDSLFFCSCGHPDYSHRMGIDDCGYEPCKCEKFKSVEIEITVEITLADIFSFQNPNLIPDSIYWWEDFKEYLERGT